MPDLCWRNWGSEPVHVLALRLKQFVCGNSQKTSERIQTGLNFLPILPFGSDDRLSFQEQQIMPTNNYLWALKYKGCMRENPTYEIIQIPQGGRTGPHYVTVNVSFPLEIGGVWGEERKGFRSWRCWRRPWKQTLCCQRCQSSRAEHEWTPPPHLQSPSPRFRLLSLSVLTWFPIFPSTSVSWNITAGQKAPSLRSAGVHNENKWAGSKYAVCVLCATLYQSTRRLSSKIKMDCVSKCTINAFQCFIYLMWNSKALSKS